MGDVPLADGKDAHRAVNAAKKTFPDWSRMPIKERAGFLLSSLKDSWIIEMNWGKMDCVDSGNALSG
ncbi:MAG: hypothetical protein CM1200mP30_17860 [Pseudomonadota bacterium]|nr:MAG: hypothetical protein CM1200mP30_17860 [Pseudomonadota bacterium]